MIAIFNLLEDKAERNLAEAIYKKHKKAMYGVAYSILKNSADAEDAVMDAVCKIINNISKFDSEASEKTRSLVMIIVRNTALNKYNYDKKHVAVSIDEDEESALYTDETPEEFFCNAESYEELLMEIRALEPIYRDVILQPKPALETAKPRFSRSIFSKLKRESTIIPSTPTMISLNLHAA